MLELFLGLEEMLWDNHLHLFHFMSGICFDIDSYGSLCFFFLWYRDERWCLDG